MLRLLGLVPFDDGWATPAGPRGARPPAAAARSPVRAARRGAPPESTEGDFRRLFSAAVSATCFSILLLGLFAGQNLANFNSSGLQQIFSNVFSDRKDVFAHNWNGHSPPSHCKTNPNHPHLLPFVGRDRKMLRFAEL